MGAGAGVLRVLVKCARNLRNVDVLSKSDPYVIGKEMSRDLSTRIILTLFFTVTLVTTGVKKQTKYKVIFSKKFKKIQKILFLIM
jgi:hypothetical protein